MRPLLDIRFKLGNLAMILLSKSSFLEALQGEFMQDGPCIAGVVVVSESILQSTGMSRSCMIRRESVSGKTKKVNMT